MLSRMGFRFTVVAAPDGTGYVVVRCPACSASKVHGVGANRVALPMRWRDRRYSVTPTPALDQEIMRKLEEARRSVPPSAMRH